MHPAIPDPARTQPVPINPPRPGIDHGTALYRLTDRLYRAQEMVEVYEAALDAITEGLGCQRASVLLFDDTASMRFVAWRGLSDHYRTALSGHSPWTPADRDPPPIFVGDIQDTSESDQVKQTILAEGIRALGFVPLTVNGQVAGKFMTYYPSERTFSPEEQNLAVTIARQIGFALERHQSNEAHRRAERELRASEERFRVMTESSPVMMWLSDSNGACLHLNRMLREFWNVREDELDRFNWADSMHPDDAPRIGGEIGRALATRSAASIKGRYRNAQGEYRVLETAARPRFSKNGEFLGMVGVNQDITERERAEQQRDLLLNELNHRVKNTLTVVLGIAHQTFKASATIDDAKVSFTGRLLALARAHDLLTKGSWQPVPLRSLASDLLDAEASNAHRIRLEGPQILLSPRYALTAAMAVHELFTNAVKYGALANDVGRIELNWTSKPETNGLELKWRETGGPVVAPPSRRGFGTLMLERILADVGGNVTNDFRPEGLLCQITMITRAAADDPLNVGN